jgi:hypothetical protein
MDHDLGGRRSGRRAIYPFGRPGGHPFRSPGSKRTDHGPGHRQSRLPDCRHWRRFGRATMPRPGGCSPWSLGRHTVPCAANGPAKAVIVPLSHPEFLNHSQSLSHPECFGHSERA